jgi:hypothetical protein
LMMMMWIVVVLSCLWVCLAGGEVMASMGRCKRGTCNHGLGVEKRCLGAYSVGMEASRSRSCTLLSECSAVAMVFDGSFERMVFET